MLCEIAQAAGLEILGRKRARAQVPWLVGNEEERERIDADLERARALWAASAEEGAPAALSAKRRVAQERRRLLRAWARPYWRGLGEQASAAEQAHDQGALFRLFGDLRERRKQTADGGRYTVAKVDQEREAWRKHFAKISGDVGQVADRVWDSVVAVPYQEWLAAAPTDLELDKCVSAMKTGRQPGSDGFVAEALKFGSDSFRSEVYALVRASWTSAAEAEDDAFREMYYHYLTSVVEMQASLAESHLPQSGDQ